VRETENEIGSFLAENLSFPKVFDDCRSMVGIDNSVALLEHKSPLGGGVVSDRSEGRITRGFEP
jgi:hypothetical protein